MAETKGMVAMSDPARNKEVVLEFLEAFKTYDPTVYERYLTANPSQQLGMTVYQGRESFADMARLARLVYPEGHRRRTITG